MASGGSNYERWREVNSGQVFETDLTYILYICVLLTF